MSNIIKQWNGRTIRVREDRYVSLTDMAQATGERVNEFLESKRTLSVIRHFYQNQKGQIAHAVITEDNNVWVCLPLAKEFCYQSKNHDFSVWMDDILWGDFSHPEVFKEFITKWTPTCPYPEIEDKDSQIFTAIYFVLNENTQEVKIGYSANPEARLSSFKSGTKDSLVLLKTIKGDKSTEKEIHQRFSEYRVVKNREIFRYEGQLKKFIDSLPALLP